ncbi:MAG: protease HtpX [Acidobacteria bacterium]|nr:protease HtpX [Acidobacteriota bacterium]
MKRILLFMVTNLAIMLTLSLVLSLLGITGGGGLDGLLVFCLFWGMGGAFLSLQISRFMAKRAMGVELVDGRTGHADLDWLHATVRQLVDRSGLPMPEVGYYESPEVNAFATGPSRSRSLVAVSTGLLRTMSRDEVEGVLAHEVAHIQNGDMVTMTLIQGVVNAFVMFFARIIANILRNTVDERASGAVYFLSYMVLQVVLGVLGMAVVAWFSRAREFRADAGAATLAGSGKMIAALQRLQQHTQQIESDQPALATMKIAGAGSWMALLSTHPPLEARIAALRAAR